MVAGRDVVSAAFSPAAHSEVTSIANGYKMGTVLRTADSGRVPRLRGQVAGPMLAPGGASTGDGMGAVNCAPTPSGAMNRAPT